MVGGIQPALAAPATEAAHLGQHGVIFVLEGAQLEVAKVGKGYTLLNADDHKSFLTRHGKDPALYRPDITHQALLAILDSPLTKSGRLKGLYVHTSKNVLIQISPHVRLPRTFRRFCGLMVQLLQKMSIRATNGPDKLLKIVKGPVTKLLPVDCRRIAFSRSAERLVFLSEFAKDSDDSRVPVFIGRCLCTWGIGSVICGRVHRYFPLSFECSMLHK
eukprot:jgi/Botrbrau1/14365/Bobra.0014s0020.1